MKASIAIALLVCTAETLFGQNQVNTNSTYEAFTPEQITRFHHNFDYDYKIWGVGGDFTRYVLLNMSKYWPHEIIYKKSPIRELRYNPNARIDNFIVTQGSEELSFIEPLNQEKITFLDYVQNGLVDGLIILHHGEIVFEQYPRMYPYELHHWMSITKTLVATVISLLEERGQINIALPVEYYLPQLKNTAWEGTNIIDVLNMSSGIDCREEDPDRSDPTSCYWNYFSGFYNSQDLGNQIELLKKMGKTEESGQTFRYSSVNTSVLTRIIEKVTSAPFNQVLQKEIWNYVGGESNALMLTTKPSGAQTFTGMSSTLRDLARYGLLFTPSGRSSEHIVISDNYLKRIQSGHNPKLRNRSWFFDEEKYNSYHWDDVYDDGDFVKYGLWGQGLYISPSRDLVIAYFGTKNLNNQWGSQMEFTRQLVKSGIFDQ